ncbi:hypothetical protein MLD38_033341 [Melastoma candidum]|uniref:Uncharacterized protein n=1 Tax=Melastoma candidum TaxID=119954 RepID=A0ACB9M889_9MYRT|nr:hypothetical protein MLD38_033341 [Melastoma candidum]
MKRFRGEMLEILSSFTTHLVLLLLFCLPINGTDTILPGESLVGNQTLISSGGKFEMGFFSPGDTQKYYLGIWYKGLPSRTVVWTANRESPVSNPSSADLRLLRNCKLSIVTYSKHQIWSTDSVPGASNGSCSGILLDSGNLVLRGGWDASNLTWESFHYPTDTWLPGQKLGYEKGWIVNTILTSWRTSDDPAFGTFNAFVRTNGVVQLSLSNGSDIYWNSGDWMEKQDRIRPAMTGLLPSLTVDLGINISSVVDKDRVYLEYSVIVPPTLVRIVLQPDGKLQQLVWTVQTQEWKVIWTQPTPECKVYPFCGASRDCNQRNVPICDKFSEASTVSLCKGEHDSFFLMPDARVAKEPEFFTSGSIESCRQLCASNCSCTAYSYRVMCLIWTDEQYTIQHLSNDALLKEIYFRFAVPSKMRPKVKMVIFILTSIIAILVLGMLVIALMRVRNGEVMYLDHSLIVFKYRSLKLATKNFSDLVGEGGFGSVFMGRLPDSTVVAVKKLHNPLQGGKQFLAEVSSMGNIQHVNLVRLIGFCAEDLRRFLVFEYMPNGSLASQLFENSLIPLDWHTRYNIAVGIAKGLTYLHERCRDCIIHCDVKPENILLDSEFRPKVADFGLAKLLGRDFSRVITTIRGTRGYLAPEWLSGQAITSKVDVFSYGKLLFEIISGKRNIEVENSDIHNYFPMTAAKVVTEEDDDVLQVLDSRLGGRADPGQVRRVCRVACWCIQDEEEDRPKMSEVVRILEGNLEVDDPPMPLFFQKIEAQKD